MTNQRATDFQFGDIRVESRNFKVYKADATVPLEPKTFLLLLFLIENRDRLVEKREILDVIWKDIAVTENALTREIGKLRKSLGDDPKSAKYIQTVHTRGYRFIAPVETLDHGELCANGAAEPPSCQSTGNDHATEDQSKPSFQRSLGRKVFAVALTLCVLIAALLLLRKTPAAAKPFPGSGVKTLAVLPFQSLTVGENNQYIGLGMADALITKLSNSERLAVQPVSTVLHYMDPKKDSLSIGHAMGVDYVLEGKFQTVGDRTRITVQLLCIACNGESHWAASFDEDSKDIFQIQDSISQKVMAALPLELSGDEQKRLAKRETSDPQAQLAFSKGKLSLSEDTKEGMDKSIEYEQFAISLDPGYAMAWAVLSDSYRRREWYGGSPADFLPAVRDAAAKASKLDDSVPYAHSMLGLIAFQYDWDFATAEREYRRARELQHSWIHQWYARYLLTTNRASEAESEYERFNKTAPFSVAGSANFAQFQFLTGQYPRALDQIHKTLGMRPDYPPAHELLGLVYEQQGRFDQAAEEFQKAIDLSHGYVGLASLGHLYATAGRRTEVQNVLQKIEAQRKQRYVAPFELAVVHAGMGDSKKALDDLEQARNELSLSAQSLRFDPRLNNLRAEPRFHDFVRRLKLE